MYEEEKMSAYGRKNEKKEFAALAIGFLLILIVIIVTLMRNSRQETSQTQDASGILREERADRKTISAKDLRKKIALEENITLLDVRSFDEYIKEHIVGATNVSLEDFPIGEKIESRSNIVIIGTTNADDSVGETAEKLKEEGFTNVSILAGGMESWENFSGPTVTYGDPNSFVDQAKVSYTDPEKIQEALKENVRMFIVDVRNSEEFSKGHISGAKNIPFDDLEKRREEISEKKVVVVGNNELQEFQASVQMYDMLLVSPYIMRGAMPEWNKKGFPIVK